MRQTPAPEDFLLKWRGDTLTVTLELDEPRKGRAAFRTNIGRAAIRRREIIDETEKGLTPLARAWTDIPLKEVSPGRFAASGGVRVMGKIRIIRILNKTVYPFYWGRRMWPGCKAANMLSILFLAP